jgi:prepilin-type N-terminal cleavage/methylation domain-containing protein
MSTRAFTLIELLVVIGIIAILSGMAMMAYGNVQLRARDAQRKNDLSQIKVALSTYYTAQSPNQFVQSSTSNPPSMIPINGSTDALSTALEPNYIKTVPVDPINSGNYIYQYQSFLNTNNLNTSFNLYATLENTLDTKGWGGGSAWLVNGYIVTND